MSNVTADEFVDLVKRSGLVERDRIEEVLSSMSPLPGDSSLLGERLVEAGIITRWQGKRLLEGHRRGFQLGNYRLLDRLGRGGMGLVFLAEHIVMRRRVAIKILPKERAANREYVERFHREARAVAALDHP